MKGRAIIELTDANGVSERIENNLVTNFFNDYLRIIANLQTTGSGANHIFSKLDTIGRRYNGLKLNDKKAYGIKLYGSNNDLNPSQYFICQDHIGYGTNSNTFTEKRGILNELSSVPIKDSNDNIIGQRIVWDFPTNCANGIINSISLTKSDNDTEFPKNHFMNGNGTFSKLFANHSNKNTISFTHEGNLINVVGDKIRIYKNMGCLITKDGWTEAPESYDEIDFSSSHSKLFKVYDFGDVYKTIGKNKISGTYEILEIDKQKFTIKTAESLPGSSDIIDKCLDMGFCGTHYIIFAKSKSTSPGQYGNYTPEYISYDLRKQQHAVIAVPVYTGTVYAGTNSMMSIKNSHGDIEVLLNYSRNDNASSRFYKTCILTQSEFGDIEIKRVLSEKGTTEYLPVINFGLLPIILYSNLGDYVGSGSGIDSDSHRGFISVDKNCVLTINNLSAPIHKTEANTMKITYELRWG